MHLDSRGYAYETYRENGRVCRRFCGRGEVARLIVQLDVADRDRGRFERHKQRAKLEQIERGGMELQAYCEASNSLFRAVAQAGGYHQLKRGAWRKKRSGSKKMTQAITPANLPEKLKDATPSQIERFDELKRAQNGDQDAADSILARMKGLPGEEEFLECLIPWDSRARESLVSIKPDNLLLQGAFERKIEKLRDELAGPDPTALEKHLSERIALCSLRVTALEIQYGKAENYQQRENIDRL